MLKRPAKIALILLAACALLGLGAFYLTAPPNPRYDGIKLSTHLLRAYRPSPVGPMFVGVSPSLSKEQLGMIRASMLALRKLDSNAVPLLVDWLESDVHNWEKAFANLARKTGLSLGNVWADRRLAALLPLTFGSRSQTPWLPGTHYSSQPNYGPAPLPDPRLVPPLRALLTNSDPRTVHWAAEALVPLIRAGVVQDTRSLLLQIKTSQSPRGNASGPLYHCEILLDPEYTQNAYFTFVQHVIPTPAKLHAAGILAFTRKYPAVVIPTAIDYLYSIANRASGLDFLVQPGEFLLAPEPLTNPAKLSQHETTTALIYLKVLRDYGPLATAALPTLTNLLDHPSPVIKELSQSAIESISAK